MIEALGRFSVASATNHRSHGF